MAAILPSDVFAGYELVAAGGTVTAQSICIPLASLTELSAGEADEATGDGAQLIRALDVAIHGAINNLTPEERPAQIGFTLTTEPTSPLTRTRIFRRTYNESVSDAAFDLIPE